MSTPICIELYPYGTIGRRFIDLALEYIDKSLYELEGDNICIYDPVLFADEIDGIINALNSSVDAFPLTGNDRNSINRTLGGLWIPGDPLSIVRYVTGSLRGGGYGNLGRYLSSAPSIVRIEFYEYSKPGYVSRITDRLKNYTYKRRMNVLSLALAIIGAYIAYITWFIQESKRYIIYFIPSLDRIELGLLTAIKERLGRAYNTPQPVKAYIVSRYITELGKQSFLIDVIGEILTIDLSGKRPVLIRSEHLSSEGLEDIVELLGEDEIMLLDFIVDEIITRYYSEVRKTRRRISEELKTIASTWTHFFEELYRGVIGVSDSQYGVIRVLTVIRDSIVREKTRGNGIWFNHYRSLKNGLGKDPLYLVDKLIRSIARAFGAYSS